MATSDSLAEGTTRTPLVCVHGYTSSWRVWQPVVAGLTPHHELHLARLPGHAGGPEWPADRAPTASALADLLEDDLDREGIEQAHFVGNSLGGWLALELASRGRARSVTALAPAFGWEPTGPHLPQLDRRLRTARQMARRSAPVMPLLARSAAFRRASLRVAVAHGDRMTHEEAVGFASDVTACTIAEPFKRWFLKAEHQLGPISCPVLIAHSRLDAGNVNSIQVRCDGLIQGQRRRG